jgi:hypothetical protein
MTGCLLLQAKCCVRFVKYGDDPFLSRSSKIRVDGGVCAGHAGVLRHMIPAYPYA